MRDLVTSKVGFTSSYDVILSLAVDLTGAKNVADVAEYETR